MAQDHEWVSQVAHEQLVVGHVQGELATLVGNP